MISHLRIYLTAAIFFCAIIFLFAEKGQCSQMKKTDTARLRRLFEEAVGNNFEIVKDELKVRSPERGGGEFWLVHVKPKLSGHFAIKYTYKYTNDKFYEAGENTLYVRVGEKICSRNQQDNTGIANVCLGDTVIVPIRTHNLSQHAFSLKYTKEETQSAKDTKRLSEINEKESKSEVIINPLASHLKYSGTHRTENLHRNGGATIIYSATFVALSAGRFNIGLSASFDDESRSKNKLVSQAGTIPIIIVNPETPITTLVPKEDTITYADNRTFSSHSGNNFLTNLLILQPGERITLVFHTTIQKRGFENKSDKVNLNVKPIVHRLPFLLDVNWSFNEWLNDYLPAENSL